MADCLPHFPQPSVFTLRLRVNKEKRHVTVEMKQKGGDGIREFPCRDIWNLLVFIGSFRSLIIYLKFTVTLASTLSTLLHNLRHYSSREKPFVFPEMIALHIRCLQLNLTPFCFLCM